MRKIKKIHFNVLIIIIMCAIVSFVMVICNINAQIANEKENMRYLAQVTARRIQTEIDSYRVSINVLENYLVEYGEENTLNNLEHLSNIVLEKDGIIKNIELIKQEDLSNSYLIEGREEKQDIQDNILLNPVYIKDINGNEKFWGFSVAIMNLDKLKNKIKLEELEKLGYQYNIWRKSPYGAYKQVLACSKKNIDKDAIKIECNVLKDIWYIELVPEESLFTVNNILLLVVIVVSIVILGTLSIWMYVINKQCEHRYEENIEYIENKAKEASTTKERFLFNMSHDVRTPLNAMLGFTKIAKDNVTDENIVVDSINKVEMAGQHLLNLLNDVLNASRIESGAVISNVSKQNLKEFGKELITIFEQEMIKNDLEFCVNYDIRDAVISCDINHIREICVNLISNAIKFTESGGKINCDIKQLDYVTENKCNYEIVIKDNGIGMSKEFQKIQYQMFEREATISTAETEGVGIGLAIVKRLVDMLNGTIECESESGRGTTYRLNFEFDILAEELKDEEIDSNKLKGKRVLLVEDIELNREIAEYILEDMGLEVESVVDGKEAVDKIIYAEPGYFDAILMDIQMPIMDGYEATRKIRELEDTRKSKINIFALTANAFEEDKENALKAGMNGHLAKPIETEKIYEALLQC